MTDANIRDFLYIVLVLLLMGAILVAADITHYI